MDSTPDGSERPAELPTVPTPPLSPVPPPPPSPAGPPISPQEAPDVPAGPLTPKPAARLADELFGPSAAAASNRSFVDLPTISTPALLEALVADGILDESAVITLLGQDRKKATIDKLEMTLVANSIVSPEILSEYKSKVSGRRAFEGAEIAAVAVLPVDVARSAGAVALNRTPATVAMVVDDPVAVAKVAEALGNDNFEIWTITAPRFVDEFKRLYTKNDVSTRPPVPEIWDVLDEMIAQDSSDLHLGVGEPPIIRARGELNRLDTQPVDKEWMRRAIRLLTGPEGLDAVDHKYDTDAGFKYGGVKFRINAGAEAAGYTLAIRRLSSVTPTMEGLNLPPSVRAFAELERGLVLVTGPTGSGKSTTLAAILGHIGVNQSRHMITLEDPIEYEIPSKRGRVQQRELGKSFTSFSEGIRQSLRQDPDVILVGEARDLETVRAAVTAAETGALVFATLHTYDAASTLGRIINQFSEGEQAQVRSQLAYVMKGVVSQTLVKSATGGRIAAFEILVGTPAVANNLRKPEGVMNIRQVIVTGARDGMQTIEYHLAQLVRKGLVTQSDAEFKARDLDEFYQYLNASE